MVNSPLQLLPISLQINNKNLVFDQDNYFYFRVNGDSSETDYSVSVT